MWLEFEIPSSLWEITKRPTFYPELDFGLYEGCMASRLKVSTLEILSKIWTLIVIKTILVYKATGQITQLESSSSFCKHNTCNVQESGAV